MSITRNIQINCFRCKQEFTFAAEEDSLEAWPYNPNDQEWEIACTECAKKLGDNTMWNCWHCGVQFQREKRGIFEPEGCSSDCENAIDLSVERAVQRQYDAIERRLEAL